MKKIALFTLLLALLYSCSEDAIISQDEAVVEKNLKSVSLNTKKDWSGQIETVIVKKSTYGRHNEVSVSVPEGYVLIGGGAEILDCTPKGALLTGSYPSSRLTTWTATSKDHIKSQNHTLAVYAIGMKIQGLTAMELMSHIRLVKTLTVYTKPNSNTHADATLPNDYFLLGGGTQIVQLSGPGVMIRGSWSHCVDNGSGNKLYTNTWNSVATDHIEKSQAKLYSYAIGIKKVIPGFGELEEVPVYYSNYRESSGIHEKILNTHSDCVLTGVGAYAPDFEELKYNRLVQSMVPHLTSSYVRTTDHLKAQRGTIIMQIMQIRKKK